MAPTALQLSLLSILLWAFTRTSAIPIDNSVRLKRQTRPWTVSEWSECSSTCGGGIRARSVRCLDEDKVIADNCDVNSRPDSHDFCGRIDCTNPSIPVPNALPASGNYSLVSPDGSEHSITFRTQDGGYTVQKNTLESDTSSSVTSVTRTPTSVTTSSSLIGRNYVLGLEMQNGLTSFTADGNSLIILNGIQSNSISPSMSLSYSSDTISISDGTTFPNIDTLYYYDGFLFYRFNTSKINSLSGPGMLYINRGVGLYSANVGLNSQLDNLIATAAPPPLTEVPELTLPTDSGSADPVAEPSTPPSASITPPGISETSPSAGPTTAPTTDGSAPVPSRPSPRPEPSTPQRPDNSKQSPRDRSHSRRKPTANPESENSGRSRSREPKTREKSDSSTSRSLQNSDSSPRSRKGRKSRPETSPMARPRSRDQSIPQPRRPKQSPLARPKNTRQPSSTRRTGPRDVSRLREPLGDQPHKSRSIEESPECERN